MKRVTNALVQEHILRDIDYDYKNLEDTLRGAIAPFLATRETPYKQMSYCPIPRPQAFRHCKVFRAKDELVVRLIVSWHGGKKQRKKQHRKLTIVPIEEIQLILRDGYCDYVDSEGTHAYDFNRVRYEFEDGSDMTALDDLYLGREAKQRTQKRKKRKVHDTRERNKQSTRAIAGDVIGLTGNNNTGLSPTPGLAEASSLTTSNQHHGPRPDDTGTNEGWSLRPAPGLSPTPGLAEASSLTTSNQHHGPRPDDTGTNECCIQRSEENQEQSRKNRKTREISPKRNETTTREPPDTPPEDQAEEEWIIIPIPKERVAPKGQGPG
jgi:hypothetical protein